jgi:hypothetical protein
MARLSILPSFQKQAEQQQQPSILVQRKLGENIGKTRTKKKGENEG